jgi:hypothetical protein
MRVQAFGVGSVVSTILLWAGCGCTGGEALTPAPDGSVARGDASSAADGRARADAPSAQDAASRLDAVSRQDSAPDDDAETGAGPCDPSMTQPVVLASTGDPSVVGVSIDSNWVYFGTHDGPGIARVAKTGGSVQKPVVGDGSATEFEFPGFSHIALDDDYVYWPADGVGVARVPIATFAEATPSLILPLTQDLRGLAVDATRVYVSNLLSTIYTGPKGGGSPTPFATSGGFIDDIAADSSGVYWADDINGLYKAAGDGGAPILLFGMTYPWNLALDDTTVYATSGGSAVVSVSKGGMNPETVVQLDTMVAAYSIAVDDQSVYWVDVTTTDASQDAVLHKAPKVGGTSTPLVTAGVGIGDIAVDGTCVYYANAGDVMRVSK